MIVFVNSNNLHSFFNYDYDFSDAFNAVKDSNVLLQILQNFYNMLIDSDYESYKRTKINNENLSTDEVFTINNFLFNGKDFNIDREIGNADTYMHILSTPSNNSPGIILRFIVFKDKSFRGEYQGSAHILRGSNSGNTYRMITLVMDQNYNDNIFNILYSFIDTILLEYLSIFYPNMYFPITNLPFSEINKYGVNRYYLLIGDEICISSKFIFIYNYLSTIVSTMSKLKYFNTLTDKNINDQIKSMYHISMYHYICEKIFDDNGQISESDVEKLYNDNMEQMYKLWNRCINCNI